MASSLIRNLSRIGSNCRSLALHPHTQILKKRYLRTTTNFHQDSEDMDQLQKNPYYSKYADKIAKLQKTSPEEFLNRLSVVETNQNAAKQSSSNEREFSLPTKPKPAQQQQPSFYKEKKLNDIMKVELLEEKSKDEIATLWTQHFASKHVVCAVIPADTFSQMKERYTIHKTFLLPLPRKEGYEFFVVQFDGNEAHFTSLINYQAFHENAPECLTMVHYVDLAETKGVVLMVGEYNNDVLTYHQAESLIIQILQFYGGGSYENEKNYFPKKTALLHRFTFNTDDFEVFDLLADYEATFTTRNQA